MKIGFDIGSKNICYVVLKENTIIYHKIISHNGNLIECINGIKHEIFNNFDKSLIESIGITGSIELTEIKIIDSILASVEASKFLKTNCNNIISIGCESFYLIILDDNYNYIEHTINSLCASGTGSFIDQQAERLGLSTEDLAKKADQYKDKAPSIATRCAVFAKSDIIHAQTQGYSKESIASGICEGVARCVLSNIIKGRKLNGKVIFIGGVSQNNKIIKEFRKALNNEIIILDESKYFNAIGAACLGKLKLKDLENIANSLKKQRELRKPLDIKLTNYPDFTKDKFYIEDEVEITLYQKINKPNYTIYIGIDIGSTSTKAVITDNNNEILIGLYTRTKGDPIKAISLLFNKIQKIFIGINFYIAGIGTTGSGRKLAKDVINADLEINEITAHAKGASFLDPDVDTIIEIGGQDSKFTLIKNGIVTQSTMNYVCAAGTGSFIEEQTIRLGISLDEISNIALGQKAPFTSDRCTVYMERDLNIFQSEGFNKNEIITAVLFSVRDNYLAKVVGKSLIGNRIYFQGATARNKALVSVFENELEKPIFVSKFCHLTGALGVSILMKEKNIYRKENFNLNFDFQTTNEICKLCSNHCDLHVYTANGKITAWGLKCGRDYEDKRLGKIDKLSNLEKKYASIFAIKNDSKNTKTIGIPKSLYMIEYYPLFTDIFNSLGFNVIIEDSTPVLLKQGLSLINSDFCGPMVLMHGLVKSLLDKNVDYIFLPSIINKQSLIDKYNEQEKFINKISDAYLCYYSEYAPTIINNLITLELGNKLISPMITFNNRPIENVALDFANSIEFLKINTIEEIQKIFLNSYAEFIEKNEAWKFEGKTIINSNSNKIKILLLGRPYSVFDNNMNLDIPKKLETRGFELIYQSMLDLHYDKEKNPDAYINKMHWYYGQEIMLATEFAIKHKNIYPVFLSCFRCSPDSYLITYFKEQMNIANKPYLIIQLDDHASDVGYQTRIEAGIETFINDFNKKSKPIDIKYSSYKNDLITPKDTVLIPYLSPIISTLQEACFNSYGYRARVLPLEQKMINTGYRYASGGECMPNVSIIGSLINIIKKEKLDPLNIILFMPTACLACNFNQFSILIDIACENAGIKGIKIANPNAAKSIEGIPKELATDLLSANILGSILYKLFYRFSPYELNKNEVKKTLDTSINLIKDFLSMHKPLMEAAKQIRILFENISVHEDRKPRIGILGDLYIKYNSILNDDIYSLIEKLGGEVLIPSFTDTVNYILDGDVRLNGLDKKYQRGLTIYEGRYERVFEGLLDDSFEPPIDECIELMHQFGIKHYINGETTINISRMLYYIKHKIVSAIIHINPVFCCPGVVSSSIARRIQKEFNIPIIDIFYDSTNKPNKIIIPHMFYLKK